MLNNNEYEEGTIKNPLSNNPEIMTKNGWISCQSYLTQCTLDVTLNPKIKELADSALLFIIEKQYEQAEDRLFELVELLEGD